MKAGNKPKMPMKPVPTKKDKAPVEKLAGNPDKQRRGIATATPPKKKA